MAQGINWKFWSRVDKAQQSTNRLRLVKRYFLSYVLVLLVPILLSVAIYRESFVLAEQQTRVELETSLNRVAQFVKMRLGEIERLVSLVDSNIALRRFQYMTDTEVREDYFSLIAVRNSLFPFPRVSSLVHDYFVLFTANRYFAAPYYAGVAETVYEERFGPYFDGYEEFRRGIVESYHDGRIIELMQATDRPGLGYLISLGMPEDPRAVVLVEISPDAIREVLATSSRSDEDWIALFSDEGTRIAQVGRSPEVVERPDNRLYVDYPISDGRLLLRAGYSVMTTSVYRRRVTAIVGVSLLLSAAVGLTLALLLSRSQSRPLQRLLREIDKLGVEHRGEQTVSARIDQIAEEHSRLRDVILTQRPVLQSAVLGKLVRGEYYSDAVAKENLRMAGITLDGYWLAAVVVTGRNMASPVPMDSSKVSEMEAVRLIIREALEEAGSYPIVDVSGSAMIAIALSNHKSKDGAFADVQQQFEFVVARLAKREEFRPVVAVGPLVNNIADLATSATRAQLLAEHLVSEHGTGVYSVRNDAETVTSARYEFPTELENRIAVAMRTGATEEATAQVRRLIDTNAAKAAATSVLMATLGAQICGMLYRVIVGLPDQLQTAFASQIELVASGLNRADSAELLIGVIRRITDAFAARKKSHNDVLLGELVNCIDANVENPDLSLALAADACGISETYAGQFFKEQSGVCFSVYVDRVRMETARRLLTENGRSVKEVAHSVGYRNVSSFNRAFKRIVGVTPGEFRRVS